MEIPTKCEHIDFEITLDDRIRCKECGAILQYAEKKLANATSMRMAKTLQEEIAVSGKYTASSFDSGFIVFSRVRNNLKEEVICKKTGNRSYQIVKRLSVVN